MTQLNSAEALRGALPDPELSIEAVTPALAARILDGYDNTSLQSPDAIERLSAAFEGRYQGGALVAGSMSGLDLKHSQLLATSKTVSRPSRNSVGRQLNAIHLDRQASTDAAARG